MPTRRHFIQQSLLAAGSLTIANSAAGKFFTFKPKKVIIIGAGFAGLSAAYVLHKKKIPFVILEARNRISGRVNSFTIDEPENLTIELGAEWVGKSHTRVQELCKEFNLDLLNNQFETHLLYKGKYSPSGQWGFTPTWQQKWKELMTGYHKLTDNDKRKLDKYDWWRYLNNNGCTGSDLEIREIMDSTDFGESIRHVSAFAALAEYAESSEKNEMDYKIKGGNRQLAEAIADAIGRENIILNAKVSIIKQNNKVEVICENGEKYSGDKLICTAPTFAAKKNRLATCIAA